MHPDFCSELLSGCIIPRVTPSYVPFWFVLIPGSRFGLRHTWLHIASTHNALYVGYTVLEKDTHIHRH